MCDHQMLCMVVLCVVSLTLLLGSIVFLSYSQDTGIPNAETIHFDDDEFDFYVETKHLNITDAIRFVSEKKAEARLFDYRVVEPEMLHRLESSLAENTVHRIWTGAYLDVTANNRLNPFDFNFVDDCSTFPFADFPDKLNNGFCQNRRYLKKLMEHHRNTTLFRVAIEMACVIKREENCKRHCPNSCLTIVPDSPSTENLVAYYLPKDCPRILHKKEIANVPSHDDATDFVFRQEKLTKQGLKKVVRCLGGEQLTLSHLNDSRNVDEIARTFKILNSPGNKEMLFWTGGSFDDLDDFQNWCSDVTPAMKNTTKLNRDAHILLRINDFKDVKGGKPCVTIESNAGIASKFFLAYQKSD